MIAQARRLYAGDDLDVDLSNTVYALDSTTIDLCLSVFPWAHFRSTKAAVKMHTLLDLRGSIPSFDIHISEGPSCTMSMHSTCCFPSLVPIYVMDRGYEDFARLHMLHQAGAFFVTRAKSNLDAHRIYSAPANRSSGLICTTRPSRWMVMPHGEITPHTCGASPLRRTPRQARRSSSSPTRRHCPALTICALYKSRWRVELFFNGSKQHLRIKQFYRTSENAVKTP